MTRVTGSSTCLHNLLTHAYIQCVCLYLFSKTEWLSFLLGVGWGGGRRVWAPFFHSGGPFGPFLWNPRSNTGCLYCIRFLLMQIAVCVLIDRCLCCGMFVSLQTRCMCSNRQVFVSLQTSPTAPSCSSRCGTSLDRLTFLIPPSTLTWSLAAVVLSYLSLMLRYVTQIYSLWTFQVCS